MMTTNKSNKILLLLILAFFIFIFSVNFSLAADLCCIRENPYTCQDISIPSECVGGSLESFSCNIISSCDDGCCCALGENNRYSTRGECDANSGTLQFVNLGYDQNQYQSYCEQKCSGTVDVILPCSSQASSCGSQVLERCYCGNSLTIAEPGDYCCAVGASVFDSSDNCYANSLCSASSKFYTITGNVKDTFQKGLSGATISVFSRQAYSGIDGGFIISNVMPSSGQMTVSLSGYVTKQVGYNTLNDNYNAGDIVLEKSASAERCEFTSSNIATWDFDGDGCIAARDSDCKSNPNYNDERDVHGCFDLTDNDCDGYYDCDDPDCYVELSSCQQAQKYETCGDQKIQQPNYFGVYEECEINKTDGKLVDGSACSASQYCSQCQCKDEIPATCGNNQVDIGEECDPTSARSEWHCTNNYEMGCSATTCTCQQAKRDCGNVNLQKPQEECEFIGSSYNDVISGSYCSASQCINPDKPGECLCRTDYSCGDGIIDSTFGEQCDVGETDGCTLNNLACDYSICRCGGCSEEAKVPKLANIVVSNDKAAISWQIECPNPMPNAIIVSRCNSDENSNCLPNTVIDTYHVLNGDERIFEDNFNGNNYCYFVKASYGYDQVYTSESKLCTNQQVTECDSERYDYFCENNSVMWCDNGKKKVVTQNTVPQDCGEDAYFLGDWRCVDYPPAQGNAKCVLQNNCDVCNGWYGMFSSYSNNIVIGNSMCSMIDSCYLDYTTTSVDKYHKCSNVKSCYDYKSEYACGDDECAVSGCEWITSTKYGEFGIGVCRPAEEQKQDCSLCEKYSLNDFFGKCNKDFCEMFGECWYDNPSLPNINFGGNLYPLGKCVHKENMACRVYDNSNDCIGGVNSSIDVLWQKIPTISPVSGTNQHIQNSSDFFNFGLCVWDGTKCFKDGNGDNVNDCTNAWCNEKDLTPPKSDVYFENPVKANLGINFSISDDDSKDTYLHFNLAPVGSECYPNGSMIGDKIEWLENKKSGVINQLNSQFSSGQYNFCWFSEDSTRNYEAVKSKPIIVDGDLPIIDVNITKIPIEVSLEDDYEWVTNLELRLNSSEKVKCDIYLTKEADSVFSDGGLTFIDKILNQGQVSNLEYSYLQDGLYMLHLECADMAGNENYNQEIDIFLDADSTITGLYPDKVFGPTDEVDGLISFNLQVLTNQPGECRFTNNPNLEFDEMIRFEKTDSIFHQHNLAYNPLNPPQNDIPRTGINIYHVKCMINGKIYGNDNDVIRFSIDYESPITKLTDFNSGEIINANKWYNTLDINLECSDPEIRYANDKRNKNYAAGCKGIKYSYNSINDINDANWPVQTSPVRLTFSDSGIYTLYYSSVDMVSNQEKISEPIILKIDNDEYEFKFEIWDHDKQQVVDTITYGKYDLYIISSKKTDDHEQSYKIEIKDVWFEFKGKKYNLPLVRNDTDNWIAKLYIDQSDFNFDKVNKQSANFFINAIDNHGIDSSKIEKSEFYIDTLAPSVPKLDPSFDKNAGPVDDMEEYYPEVFNADNQTMYTNDPHLFVTGYTSEQGYVYYYLNDAYAYFDVYDQALLNSNKDPDSQGYVMSDTRKGSNNVNFLGDVSVGFSPGKYIALPNFRKEYGHYKEYYQIIDSNFITTTTTAATLQAIEDNLIKGDLVKVYNKPFPTNWFGLKLNLTDGENEFFAVIEDTIGNKVNTKTYTIYLDENVPWINFLSPNDKSIINGRNSDLVISVSEVGTSLEKNTIKLNINGQVYDYNDLKISESKKNEVYEYTIEYLDSADFEDGVYDIYFEAYDYARNKVNKTWSYEIDSKTPDGPAFALTGISSDQEYKQVWFTDHPTDFTLFFSDSAQVIIDRINLYKQRAFGDENNKEILQFNAANCTLADYNYFECEFKNQSLMAKDGFYAIDVKAYKILTNDTSPQGSYLRMFVIDTVAPEFILDYDDTTNSNADLKFTAKVKSLNEVKLLASIVFDGDEIDLDEYGSDPFETRSYIYQKPFEFKWKVKETISLDTNFEFKLRDLAGNEFKDTYPIRIDNQFPVIAINNLTRQKLWIKSNLDAKKLDDQAQIVEVPENAYYGGEKIDIEGSIVHDDIKKITITIWTKENIMIDLPYEIKSCRGNSNKNCFKDGKFHINDFKLKNSFSENVYNYLLISVEDESENVALYTLLLVTDLIPPLDPIITVQN